MVNHRYLLAAGKFYQVALGLRSPLGSGKIQPILDEQKKSNEYDPSSESLSMRMRAIGYVGGRQSDGQISDGRCGLKSKFHLRRATWRREISRLRLK